MAETPDDELETLFEPDITCPVCGIVDYEHTEYPNFGPGGDGTEVTYTCSCGATGIVTLGVTYDFSFRVPATPPTAPHGEPT